MWDTSEIVPAAQDLGTLLMCKHLHLERHWPNHLEHIILPMLKLEILVAVAVSLSKYPNDRTLFYVERR